MRLRGLAQKELKDSQRRPRVLAEEDSGELGETKDVDAEYITLLDPVDAVFARPSSRSTRISFARRHRPLSVRNVSPLKTHGHAQAAVGLCPAYLRGRPTRLAAQSGPLERVESRRDSSVVTVTCTSRAN